MQQSRGSNKRAFEDVQEMGKRGAKMIINRFDARDIAKVLIDLVTEKVGDDSDRARLGTAVTTVFCEAMVALYPEPSNRGENICQVVSRSVATYPVEVKNGI
jgi:hypothetical protein